MTHLIFAETEAELDQLPADTVWRASVIAVRDLQDGGWHLRKHPCGYDHGELEDAINFLELP